ncbi:SsgA family sporulation/cell division regulator [Pseudonocardia humida]|uniref:SsgA family sporulation/cell division regulator n=1 Tax=Pseudonocardia humida TaxID=2800819 RepID=A0ABT0ZYL0_9PSEU|nr:SsgA family sporulation/cell division regulator [Pseudonocardia humida]MCO1655796.1 SsgA family sporulation/cell division regulator [Pseudonocardia humida]
MTSEPVRQDMFTVLHGQATPIVTRWSYQACDPFAVTLAVRIQQGHWIEWLVARDLVVQALDEPAGEGDIRMTPKTASGYRIVEIEIRSTDGRAVLEVDHDLLHRFVHATLEVVALGQETAQVDLDEAIARITRSVAE